MHSSSQFLNVYYNGMKLLGDKELVALQRRVAYYRDTTAYRRIFLYFYPKAFHFCLNYLKNRQLAEEAVSDVMMNLWLLGKKLANVKNLNVYLFSALRNKALDYLERDKKYRFQSELTPDIVSDLKSPEEAMIATETVGAIVAAIDSLPPKCKAVFTLVRELRCSYREAGEILGISENTVNRHIQLAIGHLNKVLKV